MSLPNSEKASMKAVIILLLNLSESELIRAKNGLLHETIVIAGVRSYIKSYQRWSISTFHIKKINDSLYLYSEQIFMQ